MKQASEYFVKLERVLSRTRLESYERIASDEKDALCRYIWNTALCEALYPSFQILEVGFRNALHREISKQTKEDKWLSLELPILYESELAAIKSAKQGIALRGKPLTEDILIAELSFGFWTSLLDSRYDRMWHKIIADVFPNMPRQIRIRGEASRLMHTVRRLRNAALHHHSIWHWSDLEHQHKQMRVLIGYVCASIEKMAIQVDRFPEIYRSGPGRFAATADVILTPN